MKKQLRTPAFSGCIGIGIALMFMLTVEGIPCSLTTFLTYTIFGLMAGFFISSTFIATRKFFSRFPVYTEHLLLRMIHAYLGIHNHFFPCGLACDFITLVVLSLPADCFPDEYGRGDHFNDDLFGL